ncbi:hypothetical protein ACNIU2_26475, partial [Escherichia coli]
APRTGYATPTQKTTHDHPHKLDTATFRRTIHQPLRADGQRTHKKQQTTKHKKDNKHTHQRTKENRLQKKTQPNKKKQLIHPTIYNTGAKK